MKEHILRVLTIDNPWLHGKALDRWVAPFLPAEFISRKTKLKPDHRVCLVVGPRQVGKSTLIWKHLSGKHTPFLYLNCEEPALREWLSSPALFLKDVSDLTDTLVPLFFEEVQQLPEAGLFLKGLIDRKPGVPIFATGSSSFDLESKTRESLAGRASRHLLLPFSLTEISDRAKKKSALLREQYVKHKLEQMLIYGGYPTVFLSDQSEAELSGLVEAFIIRDASDRFKIRLPSAFRKILELCASQIGNLCNFSDWASISGVSSDTVSDYVHLLQESHIIRLVRPFVGGKRAEIISTPKVFFLDNGIRNLLFGGFQPMSKRPDQGALWENFAFQEISKNIHPMLDSIRFWRSKSGAEVDFIIEHQGQIIGCEIKKGDAKGKIPRSARSFIEAYQPESFLMVNTHHHDDLFIKKTCISFITLLELGRIIRDWSRI